MDSIGKIMDGMEYKYSEDNYTVVIDKNRKPVFNSPKEIKKYLDEFVVGQEDAKRVLSVVMMNHMRTLRMADNKQKEVKKQTPLFIGSTGSGKTYMISRIAKEMGLPFITVDASTITQAGFAGKNAHEILEQLLITAQGDVEKAQSGIVFLDEFDKLATNKDGKQNMMFTAAQQSLLKIIEGSEVVVELQAGPHKAKLVVDTSNILFILGGAFSDITYEKDEVKYGIGFGAGRIEEEKKPIDHQAIIEYGFAPELVGRISSIVKLDTLDEDHLYTILTTAKGSVIESYQNMLSVDGIKLAFEEDALREVAKKAIAFKTGARSLQSVVDNVMTRKLFDLEVGDDITITKDDLNEV